MDLHTYWDSRINNNPRYSSIGNISYPEAINKYRKETVLSQIDTALSTVGIDFKDTEVLDAGCGTGVYSEYYADQGASVTGFDFAESAINTVKEAQIPGDYFVGSLPDVEVEDGQFDLVHCFSVLYHIVNDDSWRASIEKLAQATADDGTLLLRTAWVDETETRSEHVRHRSRTEYRREFSKHNLEVVETFPIIDFPRWSRVAKHLPTLTAALNLFEENPYEQILVLR